MNNLHLSNKTCDSASCPLCSGIKVSHYHRDKRRDYLQCEHCQLVYVPAAQHLLPEQEKAIYDHHQNSPDDLGYRRFLSRTTEPLFQRISGAQIGLDFGCGPGPIIPIMAAEQGFEMAAYDPIYQAASQRLKQRYDFITMTEVIEHIARPRQTLDLLQQLLKPDAILAIMTKRVLDQQAFSRWHYKNDLTHIAFYSLATFEWIAMQYQWQLEVIANDVVFFTAATNNN